MKLFHKPYETLAPNSTIGILGGGQLGLMMGLSARAMGYNIICWAPEGDCPLGRIADRLETRPYDSPVACADFIANCAVVLVEFENIPYETLAKIAEQRLTLPNPHLLRTAQARNLEKESLTAHGFQCVPYVYFGEKDSQTGFTIESLAPERAQQLKKIKFPGILKSNRMGYDGKGQTTIHNAGALASMDVRGHILEQKIEFDYEFSLLIARDRAGEILIYPPSLNHHQGGIIRRAEPIKPPYGQAVKSAIELSRHYANAMEMVGLLCIEFFAVGDELYANEMAPRPHNSFHWTQNLCLTSQFSQMVWIGAGMAMGNAGLVADGYMVNLIGDDMLDLAQYHENPLAFIHLYGKDTIREGRKMGHVNFIMGRV